MHSSLSWSAPAHAGMHDKPRAAETAPWRDRRFGDEVHLLADKLCLLQRGTAGQEFVQVSHDLEGVVLGDA